MIVKKLITISLVSLFLFLSTGKLFAAGPSFSFFPDGGIIVDKSKGFSVDVLIDTDGQEAISAKFVVLFDPTVLQLTKAERNSSLFETWSEKESSLDNENGVIMLGGFSQEGTENPYITEGEPDIMARLTFKVLKEKTTYLDWEFDTSNGVFVTEIKSNNSPSIPILLNRPKMATFQIGNGTVIKQPDTGIFDAKYLIVAGVVLALFGGFMIFTRPSFYRRGKGTIVIIGDDEKK